MMGIWKTLLSYSELRSVHLNKFIILLHDGYCKRYIFKTPIADVLGTGVKLNGDCLDPAHGLVAVAAARIVSGCRLVFVEKGLLAAAVAAGCAAHAGKAPMHRSHWSFKCGL